MELFQTKLTKQMVAQNSAQIIEARTKIAERGKLLQPSGGGTFNIGIKDEIFDGFVSEYWKLLKEKERLSNQMDY